MEKPSTSTFARPSAPMKAMALPAIPSIEVGTCPELLEMPALLNRMTSRSLAKPSVVHRPGEVLVEDERHADNLAEPAIGEADTVCLDELRRRGLVGVNHLVGPFHSVGSASGRSARAALAQSMSFCTMGAPLTPIAPTTSPFTLMGNPPPHAATRASVGMPAKSDGSP